MTTVNPRNHRKESQLKEVPLAELPREKSGAEKQADVKISLEKLKGPPPSRRGNLDRENGR